MSDEVQGYRNDDPHTSKDAYEEIKIRAGSNRAKMLTVYGTRSQEYEGYEWLTDDEAALIAGMSHTCYWKRSSELRHGGYIEPVYVDGVLQTRSGLSGVKRMLCEITPKGRDALRQMEE